MEVKTDALMLRAVDYGENYKMVTLFTAEYGKLGAAMKGVKKGSAKLKFAAQPFCFAEYVLAERSGRFTVTSASLHDGFYGLREDIATFYAATAVSEACDGLLFEGMKSRSLLIAAVNAFRRMEEGEVSSALIEFLLRSAESSGYPVQAEDCAGCGKTVKNKLFFDLASGSFFCEECAIGTPASESTYHVLRRELGLSYREELATADGEKRALRLLKAYYNYQTDGDLASLGEYIRLI